MKKGRKEGRKEQMNKGRSMKEGGNKGGEGGKAERGLLMKTDLTGLTPYWRWVLAPVIQRLGYRVW